MSNKTMNNKTLLRTGIAGSVIVAICCFTPVLVIGFGVIGLSAWVGYLDFVLLPALAFFLGLTGYALYRRQRGDTCCAPSDKGATR